MSGIITPNSMSIGKMGILPYIRKNGENPVAWHMVALYA